MRRASAALIAACLAVPPTAAAQVIQSIHIRVGPALPPVIGAPSLAHPQLLAPSPLSLSPLSFIPAVALVPAVPSVANPVAALVPMIVPAAETPAAAPSFEAPALSSMYDGTRDLSRATFADGSPAPATPAAVAPPLGSGLRMAGSEHEAWLAAVVGLLGSTRTGRRVLRDIDRLAASRGVPVLVDVKRITNNGEFRYDSGLLVMDTRHLKRDPRQSAPILAHELQHVLQRALELPTDALELEIESYTVESRVWSEIGVEPQAGSFARDARVHLAKDFKVFLEWIKGQYDKDILVHGITLDAYAARLKERLASAKAAEARTLRKRAAVERVLDGMRAGGMSQEAIEAHRHDDLEPLDRALRDGARKRAWLERDLRLLSDPVARARFRSYVDGVIRRARALSRT